MTQLEAHFRFYGLLMKGKFHGLRTPNEGINQKKSENLGRCGRQNMLWPYLKIWEWELIFGCAVKAISSPGVHSQWKKVFTIQLQRFGDSSKELHSKKAFFRVYFGTILKAF